jgi:hypothetical protein
MDQQLEKAFQTANFMATLTNQRNVAFEEYQQNLIYYTNGSSFLITKELISFVKLLLDGGFDKNTILIDANNIPVKIANLEEFYQSIINQYVTSSLVYFNTYTEIRSKRNIEDLVKL